MNVHYRLIIGIHLIIINISIQKIHNYAIIVDKTCVLNILRIVVGWIGSTICQRTKVSKQKLMKS